MADKREQCEKCTMNCPPNIIRAKINKGRIPYDKCMDFSPIQSNADRIRSMTDEELAHFLVTFKNNYGEEYEGEMSCLDWLQSEVEEK